MLLNQTFRTTAHVDEKQTKQKTNSILYTTGSSIWHTTFSSIITSLPQSPIHSSTYTVSTAAPSIPFPSSPLFHPYDTLAQSKSLTSSLRYHSHSSIMCSTVLSSPMSQIRHSMLRNLYHLIVPYCLHSHPYTVSQLGKDHHPGFHHTTSHYTLPGFAFVPSRSSHSFSPTHSTSLSFIFQFSQTLFNFSASFCYFFFSSKLPQDDATESTFHHHFGCLPSTKERIASLPFTVNAASRMTGQSRDACEGCEKMNIYVTATRMIRHIRCLLNSPFISFSVHRSEHAE